jgi:hypothetical protein
MNGVKLVAGANSVSTLNLNAGVYVVVAVTERGDVKTSKFVIR